MKEREDKPFDIYQSSESKVVTTYEVYLGDDITCDSSDYTELLNTLYKTSPNDIVNIHLANFGGAVHSGERLIHAIKGCPSHVEIIVEAPCYSMGAIIALCGTSLTMRPGTFLMFHNFTATKRGKAGELKLGIVEYEKHFSKLLKLFCSPFLTKKERVILSNDKDVYIHEDDEDYTKRIARHFK